MRWQNDFAAGDHPRQIGEGLGPVAHAELLLDPERKSWARMATMRYGYADVAQLLLDNGANINTANTAGNTALHYAASNGYADVAQLLLAKGANINAANTAGNTALHSAIKNRHKNVERLIKETVTAERRNKANLSIAEIRAALNLG